MPKKRERGWERKERMITLVLRYWTSLNPHHVLMSLWWRCALQLPPTHTLYRQTGTRADAAAMKTDHCRLNMPPPELWCWGVQRMCVSVCDWEWERVCVWDRERVTNNFLFYLFYLFNEPNELNSQHTHSQTLFKKILIWWFFKFICYLNTNTHIVVFILFY